MIAGVLAETLPGERRVAVVPGRAARAREGRAHRAIVQSGAGAWPPAIRMRRLPRRAPRLSPSAADVVARADLLLRVRHRRRRRPTPGAPTSRLTRPGQTLIAFLDPLASPLWPQALAARGVTALLDGADAAHHARAEHGRALVDGDRGRLQGRAAGRQPRCRACSRCSRRRPARSSRPACSSSAPASPACRRSPPRGGLARAVEAYDVRPAAKEQVQSVGAKFVELPLEAGDAEDKGGYAKAQDESFYRRQREMMAKVVAGSDVVITTAAIPGKRSPVLVTAEMVKGDGAGLGDRRSGGRARRQLRADEGRRDRHRARRHDPRADEPAVHRAVSRQPDVRAGTSPRLSRTW